MYFGWIPNVSGYLSLSHLGGLPIRHRVLSEQIYPPTKFHVGNSVSLLQERNLSDRPEIGLIKFGTAPGTHYFLLQAKRAEADCERRLEGVVISVPAEFAHHLKDAHQAFISGNLQVDAPLPHLYQDFLLDLRQTVGAGHFALSFAMADDGVIALNSLANAGPEEKNGQLLAFEAYSFVKDVLHKHRFHHGADDALLELTQADTVEDPAWCKNVIRNLHRSIIASFRTSSKLAQANSLGKLAYLESFLEVVRRRKLNFEPDISVSTLREALIQYQSCAQEEKEDRNLTQTFLISMLAIAIPLFLVCLQLLQIPCIDGLTYAEVCGAQRFTVSPVIKGLAGGVLKYLEYVMLGGIVLFGLAVFMIFRRRFDRYTEVRSTAASWTGDVRDLIFRLSVSYDRWTNLAFASAAILFILVVGWCVRWLLTHPLLH